MQTTLPLTYLPELTQYFQMGIDIDTLSKTAIEAPILQRVALLLERIGSKGLKLTPKGKLPTAVVKDLISISPDLDTQKAMELTKRTFEDDFYVAAQTRIVCELGKLIKVSNRKLQYGSMVKRYLHAPTHEQYLYLLDQYEQVNLGYFDGYQEEILTHDFKFLLLQILRDREVQFRSVGAYMAFLYSENPMLQTLVEETIIPDRVFSSDVLDQFDSIIELRLFKRHFAPFGLIEEPLESDNIWMAHYEVRATSLLQALLASKHAIDCSQILTPSLFKKFQKEAKALKIDHLFHDFSFAISRCMHENCFNPQKMAKEVTSANLSVGIPATQREAFYKAFFSAVLTTFRYFTRLEEKGKYDDSMQKEFYDFIEGVYRLLDEGKNKPYELFMGFAPAIQFFSDMLHNLYGTDLQDTHFQKKLLEQTNEEILEEVTLLLASLTHFEKKAKKSKRISAKLKEAFTHILTTYLLTLMEIHAFRRDGFLNIHMHEEHTDMPPIQEKVYQLRIDLMDTKPPIWRRILIKSSASLYDLHCAIQHAMGWMNGHLHRFEKDNLYYGPASDEDDFAFMETLDERGYTIADLLGHVGAYLHYEYDFGDGWRHRVRLEKIHEQSEVNIALPACIKGKNACPPEDVGGVWGYYGILEILQDPTHPEYEETVEWIGGTFDPAYFDLEEANTMMKEGCIALMGL